MNRKIITISREFGSGGRELGKHMANILGFAYFDREIITEIAERHNLAEEYVVDVLAKKKVNFPFKFGRTFSLNNSAWRTEIEVIAAEQQIVREVATAQNCIIIGRNSDDVLKDMHPFNIFVYADMPSKIKRCREHAPADESICEDILKRKIYQIDQARAQRHNAVSSFKWGRKEGYNLCVNTSGCEIKQLAPIVAAYAKTWFKTNIVR